jgi:Cu2+-exporting ATPase
LLAVIAITDQIKATSVEAVKELKRQGVEICMLTVMASVQHRL